LIDSEPDLPLTYKHRMDKKSYTAWAEILKTLGHPTRIRILESLLDAEKCVSTIWANLDLPQSTVSQHLSVLRSKGIVQHERCGAKVKYFVKDRRIEEIIKLIKSR
jgi:DNA-binding transcriptional ArsR family regulator